MPYDKPAASARRYPWSSLVAGLQYPARACARTVRLLRTAGSHSRPINWCIHTLAPTQLPNPRTDPRPTPPPTPHTQPLPPIDPNQVGVQWLHATRKLGIGGILADEMGLGKTAQIATMLADLKSEATSVPVRHLVVVPASVIDNWMFEMGRWAPGVAVLRFHGSQAERRPMRKNDQPYDVILTTFSLFEPEGVATTDREWLLSQSWDTVIVDEAQAVKSCGAARVRQMQRLESQHRVLLTGAPVQNNLTETFALLQFVMPALFPAAVATAVEESVEPVKETRHLLEPFMLRRTKASVLPGLPSKTLETTRLTMGQSQAALYTSMALNGHDNTAHVSRLRLVASMPCLVRSQYNDTLVAAVAKAAHAAGLFDTPASLVRVTNELKAYSDFEIHSMCAANAELAQYELSTSKLFDSAKLGALRTLLPELRSGGHRVLIFTPWTQVLDVLQAFFKAETPFQYSRLDGSTPVEQRQPMIDAFNSEDGNFAFLLTTRAGGQGINLTGADTVIILDMDWSSQADTQAEDRAHRIGQRRSVRVIRLLTRETIDVDVQNTQEAKKELCRQVLAPVPTNPNHGHSPKPDPDPDPNPDPNPNPSPAPPGSSPGMPCLCGQAGPAAEVRKEKKRKVPDDAPPSADLMASVTPRRFESSESLPPPQPEKPRRCCMLSPEDPQLPVRSSAEDPRDALGHFISLLERGSATFTGHVLVQLSWIGVPRYFAHPESFSYQSRSGLGAMFTAKGSAHSR